ncbi:MAG TPA: DegT/DnrJ/EryC1/StrS family aminotransferase [bacterium]|nr:DegT/DnrJ/EryC1/StrS family aminotransferase [bacterium]
MTLPPRTLPDDLDLLPPADVGAGGLDAAAVVARDLQEQVAAPLTAAFGASSCHFAGRGAAALLALAQALDAPGQEVIVPTLVCPSVPLALMLGGLVPVFADVRPGDYTLDVAHAANLITPRTVALVAVHIFGHPCDMGGLRALADAHSLFLIEDCAQSLGQLDGNTWVGSIGDAAILSFHPSKILPAAGGGAVLLQPSAAHLAPRIDQAIAAFPEECALEAGQQRELARRGNAILNTARLEPSYAPRYRSLVGELSQGLPCQVSIPQLQGIWREWDTLDQVVPQRELRARRYRALLGDPLLVHPAPRGGAEPLFRYTLRPALEGEQAVYCTHHLTAALRHYGFHASNLYFPVHALLGQGAGTPVADAVGRSVLNLWLDGSATAEQIMLIRQVLGHVLRRTACTAPPSA